MDPDQRVERRNYMRKELLSYPGCANLSNSELDQMRLLERFERGYLIEDSRGIAIFLLSNCPGREETDLRKVRAMMLYDFMDTTAKDF